MQRAARAVLAALLLLAVAPASAPLAAPPGRPDSPAGAVAGAAGLGGRALRSEADHARPSVVLSVVRLGPGRTATFLNLMPFVVIALAWALLGEAVHAYPRGRRRPRHRGRGADDDALRAT